MKAITEINIFQLILLAVFVLSLNSDLYAQEPKVLRVSQINEFDWTSNSLQRNGDHFYLTVGNLDNSNRDLTNDLEIDSFILPEVNGSNSASVLFDYKLGEGFVNYEYVSYSTEPDGFSKNDSLSAYCYDSIDFMFNGNTYGSENNDTTLFPLGSYIWVFDHLRDSLRFITKTEKKYRLFTDGMTLDGDYLYVVTHTNEDTFEFMGEFFPEVIDPNWNVKHVHKINWKTGLKEWSHQFSTDYDYDNVMDIKVVEDGNLIIAKRISGKTYWDGVQMPGNHYLDSGYAFFKISPEGDLVDYIQSACYCKGFHQIHIEDDGSLLLYGAQINMPNLTLGDAFLEMYTEVIPGTPFPLIGLLGYVPSDWENAWIKTFLGYDLAVTGAGVSHDGESIIPIIGYKESAMIEGDSFKTADYGLYETYSESRREYILLSYSKVGDLIKRPITMPLNGYFHEIIEVEKDHYLCYFSEDNGDESELYGTSLDPYYSQNFSLFEIEGDIFDITNNLDELLIPHVGNLIVHPNPVSIASPITIDTKRTINKIDNLILISSSGEIIELTDYSINNTKVDVVLPILPQGVYIIQLQYGIYSSMAKLIIK
ncbi:MAG: frataxin-like iron-binding protein CyaY [Saprospiraceae bacterium]|jgi:frataxin-like iron-binding protein CyaY